MPLEICYGRLCVQLTSRALGYPLKQGWTINLAQGHFQKTTFSGGLYRLIDCKINK